MPRTSLVICHGLQVPEGVVFQDTVLPVCGSKKLGRRELGGKAFPVTPNVSFGVGEERSWLVAQWLVS